MNFNFAFSFWRFKCYFTIDLLQPKHDEGFYTFSNSIYFSIAFKKNKEE